MSVGIDYGSEKGDHTVATLWNRKSGVVQEIDVELAEYIQEIQAALDVAEAQNADLKEVLEDKRRLTRELDVAMNGEEGAAAQASLCDLVHPAEKLREENERLRAALQWLRANPTAYVPEQQQRILEALSQQSKHAKQTKGDKIKSSFFPYL